MPVASEPALVSAPRRRTLSGQILTTSRALAIAVRDGEGPGDPSRYAQVLSTSATPLFRPGYAAYLFQATDLPTAVRELLVAHNSPCLVGIDPFEDLTSGDIIDINHRPGHARITAFAGADDQVLLLTNRCNSNCLMCPDPEGLRRGGEDRPPEWIARYLALLPPATRHLSLTGGEPTLLRDRLFPVLDLCRQHLPDADLLLITNGRLFYYRDYARQLAAHCGPHFTLATALHAARPEAHDRITGAPGSFVQTLQGVRNLLDLGVRVEVRIVIQQANRDGLYELARLIGAVVPGVAQVSFMGLELLGNAAQHRETVWLDYRAVTPELSRAVRYLLGRGIVPRLYNLPLCLVAPAYWSLCAKSIAYHKRTYKAECADCTVRAACGGLFGTPLNHRLMEVRPVRAGGVAEDEGYPSSIGLADGGPASR